MFLYIYSFTFLTMIKKYKKYINKYVIYNFLLIYWIHISIVILILISSLLSSWFEQEVTTNGIILILLSILVCPLLMNYWIFVYNLIFDDVKDQNFVINILVIWILNLILTFFIVTFYVNRFWKKKTKTAYKISILFTIWWLFSCIFALKFLMILN